LASFRNFTKIRATVEKEYGNALLKLATTYLQKKPPPGIELKSEDNQENNIGIFYLVMLLLNFESDFISPVRAGDCIHGVSVESENISFSLARSFGLNLCFESLRRIQDEVQQCVQEVDKTKKLYFEEEHMAHDAREKAQDAEEKLKKKKGRIFQSITSLQKNSQKFSSRREACDIQSTKARNDYIMALVAANAHQTRFYETDLPDILQSLDCDVSEKVKEYIQLMSRTELLTVTACNTSFTRILDDAGHITRQYTVECFLQENQVLGKPITYEFDPCDNDQIRTICTEHHADLCLSKDAKKWASAFMKDCRTLRDANKELSRILGQIAKGERTMESSTGEQEDIELKLEDIRNAIRKAETSKMKAEARLEALREGGVNVDEFLNSLDIDSLQIDDLSRKGSTASRGSRKSSRTDSETNESFYESDFDGSSDASANQTTSFVAGTSDSGDDAVVERAPSTATPIGGFYEQDPTAVVWDEGPDVSASAVDVSDLDESRQDSREDEQEPRPAQEREDSLQVSIKCFGLFSYEAANPDELSFVEQEEMEIISEGDGDGWIKARNYKGEEGFIPQNYVEIVDAQQAGASGESFSSVDYRVESSEEVSGDAEPAEAAPVPPEAVQEVVPPTDFPTSLAPPGETRLSTVYCRAIYDYEPSGSDELAFQEGQVIRILRKVVHDDVDDGWWEGEIDGQVGIFPSLMVEALKITGEPQTPMDDPSMDALPPPPAFTPPKPAFLVTPSQVLLTQPTPDQEQGDHESSDGTAVQAPEEATSYAPLVSSPESPATQETTVSNAAAEEVESPKEDQKKLPHQQTVTVVIDSPDEPPREFADSDDEDQDNADQSSVVEVGDVAAAEDADAASRTPDDAGKPAEPSEAADDQAVESGSRTGTSQETSSKDQDMEAVPAAVDPPQLDDACSSEKTVPAAGADGSGDGTSAPVEQAEELANEDEENNNAAE
ncbi:unnamed protein product, partial [Ixodes hexagonus]